MSNRNALVFIVGLVFIPRRPRGRTLGANPVSLYRPGQLLTFQIEWVGSNAAQVSVGRVSRLRSCQNRKFQQEFTALNFK